MVLDAQTDHPKVIAVAEERITGVKYAGGYEASLDAVLAAANLNLANADVIGVSTCCEPAENSIINIGHGEPTQLLPVGHHESHAALSFVGSGFDTALVAVLDGGGDVIEPMRTENWWEYGREQQSYYYASQDGGLQLLARDFDRPYDTGFGELYRALCYFLGWPGSRHASSVMALSAYGQRRKDWPPLFQIEADGITCPIRNSPMTPLDMIHQLGDTLGIDVGERRSRGAELLQIHKDLATFLQRELEEALILRIRGLLQGMHVDGVCLGGGVALNVLANGRVAMAIEEKVYVPPAPADDGQALGNALRVAWGKEHIPRFSMTTSQAAYLGPPRRLDSAAVSHSLTKTGNQGFAVFEYTSSAPIVAKCLASGSAVCVFQERSEYGPRALGSRSILGDPTRLDGRAFFNSLKGRDWFMPFAPTVLVPDAEALERWLGSLIESPFMSFAIPATDAEIWRDAQCVVSHDGTARVQTLSSDSNSFIGQVVENFSGLQGIPMVLNTSFNGGGAPIVETVDDAINTFAELAVNLLALGRFLVVKSLSPELIDAGVMPATFPLEAYLVRQGTHTPLGLTNLRSRECIRSVQRATGAVVFVRSELPLYGPYLDWLREGRKVTTIRFRRGGVELPSFSELPLFETADYGVGDRSTPTAIVRIERLRYQIFGELTEDDAKRDGFESLAHLHTDLKKIYPALGNEDWVTIYDIGLLSDASSSASN